MGISYNQFDSIIQKVNFIQKSHFYFYYFKREINNEIKEFTFTISTQFVHIPPEITISYKEKVLYSYSRNQGLFHKLFRNKDDIFISNDFFEEIFNEVNEYLDAKIQEINRINNSINSEVKTIIDTINTSK